MPLGEILMAKNLLDEQQLEKATERQKVVGGLLGDNLVALVLARPEIHSLSDLNNKRRLLMATAAFTNEPYQ